MDDDEVVRTLSPGDAERRGGERARRIVEFWNALRTEELDAARWEVLEPIERQVTECLDRRTPRIAEAESLTAQAMVLLVGNEKQ